jgi:integral membrane protein (TIGR00529 family)
VDVLKLLVVFVAIVIALRRAIPAGPTLFGAGLLTAVLYQASAMAVLKGYYALLQSEKFVSLTLVVILITILGCLLKELGFLEKLALACQGLPGGSRTAVAVLPGLVGLMPMPGGSLLSAPLVEDVLSERRYSSEFKIVTNYWFRHIVEFVWPVYPGLILTEAITGMPIGKVSLLQCPLTLVMIFIGLFFFIRKVEPTSGESGSFAAALRGIGLTIWPIVLAICIYAVVRIELALAILISLVLLVVVARPVRGMLSRSARKGLSYNLIVLVFGVLSFQTALEVSGAIGSVTRLTTSGGFPPEAVIFVVCFTVGLLTGMTSAYVGLGFTLLAPLIYQPKVVTDHLMLGYFAGYLGIMLSPSHLCLILTNEYFKGDLAKVYRMMAIPLTILALAAFLIYLSPWPSLIR